MRSSRVPVAKVPGGRFSAWVGRILMAACFAALAYGVATHGLARDSLQEVLWTYGLPLLGLAVAVALPRLRPDRRDALALGLVAGGTALYLAETALSLMDRPRAEAERICARDEGEAGVHMIALDNCIAAVSRGLEFETRSRLSLIDDLEARGERVVPAAHVGQYLNLVTDWPLLPLGGIADATTLYCNETGRPVTYESDPHGFRNPAGPHDRRGGVALVGDSFIKGHCVPEEEGLAGLVREVHPNTINLGADGTGPLSVLATIREYATHLEPGVVLWGFYEGNDLADLGREARVPLLNRYLDQGFTQNLKDRQPEIDTRLQSWVDMIRHDVEADIERRRALARPLTAHPVVRFVLLTRVRGLVTAAFRRDPPPDPPGPELLEILGDVANRVRLDVEAWGGRLILVYLPERRRFESPDGRAAARDAVIGLFEGRGIEVLDVTPAFEAHPDPLSLWPFRIGLHYTAEGYRIASDRILEALSS